MAWEKGRSEEGVVVYGIDGHPYLLHLAAVRSTRQPEDGVQGDLQAGDLAWKKGTDLVIFHLLLGWPQTIQLSSTLFHITDFELFLKSVISFKDSPFFPDVCFLWKPK